MQKREQEEVSSFSPPSAQKAAAPAGAVNRHLVGTWEWDPAHNSSRISPELYHLFGTDAADPDHTKKWAARVHPADWKMVQQSMKAAAETGQMDFEYRYQNPDMGLRWFYCKGSRLHNDSRMFGLVMDITLTKQTAEPPQQSEEQRAITGDVTAGSEAEKAQRRLAAIIESSEDAIASKDLNGIITSWNKSAERMFGYAAEEIIGQPVTLIIPPELHQDEPRILGKIRAGERIEHFQTVRVHKNGRLIDVSLTVSPIKDQTGKIVGAAKIVRDITRQKKLEEAALRLAAIVESSDDAIASKDLNGIITSWNRSAEKLFGYTAEEIIGKSIITIIPPELHQDENMILSKIRRGERIEHFETIRLHKNGERLEVSLTISPVRDENGNVIGAAKIIRNITETNKIERALQTTEKLAAAGRMAATVAHEINNPLEAVTNLVYLAKRDLSNNDRVIGYLELASRELDRVAHITRQTLGFYRDSSSPVLFDVPEALDNLLLLYEKRLESRNIAVLKQYDNNAGITALAGEIRQALSNLITNSIDAMPTGGKLILRVSRTHQWNRSHVDGVRLTILDTGSGIEPKHRKNIFQPFFTTKKDVGTGLGLWITRGIFEKHRGTIRMKSRTGQDNHGTAFSIFLPREYIAGSSEASSKVDNPLKIAT